ncbi:MAG TPA: transglycosylase SLT domain-containing protein [Chitinispirillaceae bacterium]|nr:transglycosylase SLT domain-containing protein [Chitinispirillaceae bacterium]
MLENMNRTFLSILFLVAVTISAQQNYFGKALSPLLIEKKAFWKRFYAEIDSSMTVLYDKKSLKTYTIVKNEYLSSTVDSLKKVIRYPNQIMAKQGRREFVNSAIRRAAEYSFVVDSLAIHRLHPDLRWLPVLESGYLDTMVSDQNARGIWQFIPSTRKKYGLLPDDIAEPHKSTSAFVAVHLFLTPAVW